MENGTMKNAYGWTGKILNIDLNTRKISTRDTVEYSKRFLGGIGIGEKIYWDESSPDFSAFNPGNPLILMTGPLGATQAPSAPRIVVCGKSPCIYPETFVNASLGGFFPAELKKAGYDGIVIKGKADSPVYLSIKNEKIEIRDASHLWGLTNSKTHHTIRKEVGEKVSILSTGPGGENGTRIGIIFTDVAGSGSMGFGSVMGSKNLKAIAAIGTGRISVADTNRIKLIRKKLKDMTGEGYYNLREIPITLPGTEVVKKVHCHGCPQGCSRSLQRRASGVEDIRKCQTGIFYSMWDRRLHQMPTDASFQAATIANEYSICVMELVFLLLWLDKCLENSILTEKDIELPVSKMGSIEFFESMIKKISYREGFGSILAEGAIRASEIVGKESREITRNLLTQTGRAIAYGPKVFIHSALIYATEPRPFITELHEICEPLTKWALWYTSKGEKSYVSTDVLRRIGKKFWGSEQAVDFSTDDGKALASVLIQNRQYVKESLILCDFAWPVYDDASTEDHVGDPTLESQLLSAVIGKEIDEKELNHIGERIFSLNRAILLREGRKGREDDFLPEFFFEEREERIPDAFGMRNTELFLPGSGDEVISRKGKAVDKKIFEKMKDDYYELRDWDVKTGLLKKDALTKLDLSEMIEPLKEKVV
jgi:aldehyde:ferredoxin oxidoreductase